MTPELGQKTPEATTPTADAGRLLVVDDNEMNRDMLSRRLARRGHEVVTAEGGAVALELIGTEAFDVILLDIMMPGIDGLEV
ncbi:MAG: response regulator, partial [Planctomycetes bacterium]|nr:response regulator [Planctomycetota bacterium]